MMEIIITSDFLHGIAWDVIYGIVGGFGGYFLERRLAPANHEEFGGCLL